MAKRGAKGITIIKREEIIAGGHHGGAWKVAYADFVTAMMAFFLLMWLLNATTEEQRRGLADYFSPVATLARGTSGSGKPFGGQSPYEDGPAVSDRGTIKVMNANAPPLDIEDDGSDTRALKVVHVDGSDKQTTDGKPTGRQAEAAGKQVALLAEASRKEQAAFAEAAAQMKQAIANDPSLASLGKQLVIDLTPAGLRVQIRDDEAQPMFATGSSDPNARAQALLHRLIPILAGLQETISIAGYTDAQPYTGTGRSNWDLSTERANSTRRVLNEGGLAETRIRDVTGHAERDLLLPKTPLAAANRRIAILLLRSVPVVAPISAALPPVPD